MSSSHHCKNSGRTPLGVGPPGLRHSWGAVVYPTRKECGMPRNKTRGEALDDLLKSTAFEDAIDFLERYALESVVPGVCIRKGCIGAADYEPDCRNGHCPECGEQSIRSGLVLLGII